ncbi:terminase small subunit [uncultured Mediterranean phage]|nr:terminase small subunit [uncultured Mediterranean phage]
MDRSLTEKQQAFIENFSQTGNAKQSAIKAGYSEATAEQQGHNLKKQLSNEIDEATKKLMSSHVPLAVDKLKDLISNPKISASVQLGAVNSLLDRSGYQTITKIEDVTGRKTDAELREELRHLLGTIAVVKGPYDPSGTNGSGSIQ